MIYLSRVYDYEKTKGKRILVDRLWPRGIKKEDLKLDGWYKEITPSNELRKWYHNHLDQFETFKEKYYEEIKDEPILKTLQNSTEDITLLYAAKNKEQNHAILLKSFIENKQK